MKKIFLSLFISFFIFTHSALAAGLFFDTSNTEIKTGSFFEVTVILNSPEQKINAVEGSVYFPGDLLNFVNIRENNSIINFWVEKPQVKTNNSINFSGIVPGGYLGEGNLFKIIFKTKATGQGELDFKDVKVLLNDGLGTELSVSQKNLSFIVSDQAPVQNEVVIVDLSDQYPPEPFTPIITKIPEIAGDNYVLVFATQDKDSGVDYYQVKEGLHAFVNAESPYVLKNQKLDKKIIVKAFDKSGNVRQVTIAAVNVHNWYENFWIFVIILLVVLFYLAYRYQQNKIILVKNKKKNKK